MDGPRENYAKWINVSQWKKDTTWPHLYVESDEHSKLMNKIVTEV